MTQEKIIDIMRLIKICKKCGKEFKKPYFRSIKNWEKDKFCSRYCYSKSIIGKDTWNKGKKGIHLSPKSEFKKGNHPKTEFKTGIKNPNWNNGSSFKPYGLEFNEDLKEVIRNRERRKCFICNKTELENKSSLQVHHIDYDKNNNNPNNLIAICRICHSKTNHNRNNWINYFKERLLK